MPKIKLFIGPDGRGEVYLDGLRLQGVERVAIDAKQRDVRVNLTFVPEELLVSAENAEIVARYAEREKPNPPDVAINPDAPNVRGLVSVVVDALKREFPWLSTRPQDAAADMSRSPFPRRVLDCRGSVDGVGRVSLER